MQESEPEPNKSTLESIKSASEDIATKYSKGKQYLQQKTYENVTQPTGKFMGKVGESTRESIGEISGKFGEQYQSFKTGTVKPIKEGASKLAGTVAEGIMYTADKASEMADKASEMAKSAKYRTIEYGLGKQAADEEKVKARAFKKILDAAEKRPDWADGIAGFFYNINLAAAFAFDSLLFYTPGRNESPPDVVSFFTKLLIIGAAYIVINVALSVFIYGIFIPVFYKSYASSYSSFQGYLKGQYKAYQSKFGVKLLSESSDPKTMGILAAFESISDPSINTSKNVSEYKNFIKKKDDEKPNIDNMYTIIKNNLYKGKEVSEASDLMKSLDKKISDLEDQSKNNSTIDNSKKIEDLKKQKDDVSKKWSHEVTIILSVTSDTNIEEVKNFFLELPDKFSEYAKIKESYVYRSIQYWVLMLCVILLVIPIKYIIVESGNSPELPQIPAIVKGTVASVAKGTLNAGKNIGSMMSKKQSNPEVNITGTVAE